jgi:hypothetical protein
VCVVGTWAPRPAANSRREKGERGRGRTPRTGGALAPAAQGVGAWSVPLVVTASAARSRSTSGVVQMDEADDDLWWWGTPEERGVAPRAEPSAARPGGRGGRCAMLPAREAQPPRASSARSGARACFSERWDL